MEFATKTFRKTVGQFTADEISKLASKIFMLLHISDSLYGTAPLTDGLKEIFGADRKLFSHAPRDVRVAVTSAKDNGADRCLIANYNRSGCGEDDQDFEREDDDENEMKIWEAALATASAPLYFPKFEKLETGNNYTDGALHANCPAQYTLEEIRRLWKSTGEEEAPLDILLSIGTGVQEKILNLPLPLRFGGFETICTAYHHKVNSQHLWDDFKKGVKESSRLAHKVHRLNARIEGRPVDLDDYKRMGDIDRDITRQVTEPRQAKQIRDLADILISDLFFFEPSPIYRDSDGFSSTKSVPILGTIRCRLAKNSVSLRKLVDIIGSFWYTQIGNDTDETAEKGWDEIPLPDDVRSAVRIEGRWLRVECALPRVEPPATQHVLAVSLRRGNQPERVSLSRLPISGFPVEWHVLRQRVTRKRYI
jgi:hypothetical protein